MVLKDLSLANRLLRDQARSRTWYQCEMRGLLITNVTPSL